MNEKILIKVEGMDCANCATTISRTLTKNGHKEVNVDFISGEVSISKESPEKVSEAVRSISRLGYTVKSRSDVIHAVQTEHADHVHKNISGLFLICLVFTLPLVLHMFLPFEFFHRPVVQLVFSLPVMYIGFTQFGKSAFYSVRSGVPNMDVLIFTGSTAAFIYSLSGMILYADSPNVGNYMFFETGCTIITLVLLGNMIEQRSVRQTTDSLAQLSRLQPDIAKKIIQHGKNNEFEIVKVSELKKGDHVQVNTGDKVPLDGEVISGKGYFNESMITGESSPVFKSTGENVIGGTLLEDGNIVATIKHTGNETILAGIIELVKSARHSKPEIQKLGDRISAIFVPVVLVISLITFVIAYFFVDLVLSKAIMNSIAVLVISCPCAMGLATPTAVMVGLGRAARSGILIKGGSTIETLAGIKTVVFDKTGTLTTGDFSIKKINAITLTVEEIKTILFSLEKHSSHPIAKSIQKELKNEVTNPMIWKEISEDKGIGINATDENGDLYSAGSFQIVKHFYDDLNHDIYILKNNKLVGTVELADTIKKDSKETIDHLKKAGIRVILLSGDRKQKCEYVAEKTGIETIYFEKLPSEKLEIISSLSKENPTAMIGDGINDAPALAMATVGISFSNATEAAIQTAQVVLLDRSGLNILVKAIKLGEETYSTIRQNLFWAFFYNVLAIPIAAAGYLSPMIGALSMAFSDMIVIGNSLRLKTKKLN